MRLKGGTVGIDTYSKKQRRNAHPPGESWSRENGVCLNDQKLETCWNDYATLSQISCASRGGKDLLSVRVPRQFVANRTLDGHSGIDTAFQGKKFGFYGKGPGLIGMFMTE